MRTLLTAVVALALAPLSAHAQAAFPALAHATPIAASGGVQAWSEYDRDSHMWRLIVRRDGVIAPAPVAPSDRAFDVDLAPGPDGAVTAAYSRCRGSDCRLFLWRVGAAAERATHLPGRRPALWRGQVAWSRRGAIAVSGLDGRHPRIVPVPRFAALGDLDLHAGQLAFSTTTSTEQGAELSDLWLATAGGGAARRIARFRSGESAHHIVTPTLAADGTVTFGEITSDGGGASGVWRQRLRTGRRSFRATPDAVQTVRDGATLFQLRDPGSPFYPDTEPCQDGCSLVLL